MNIISLSVPHRYHVDIMSVRGARGGTAPLRGRCPRRSCGAPPPEFIRQDEKSIHA